jgi:ACDE family multidrug resistance protein
VHVPFAVAAGAVLVSVGVLATGHRLLADADAGTDWGHHPPAGADGHSVANADAVEGEVADEFGGASGAIDEVVNAR